MRSIDGDELLEKMYRYTDNEGVKMPYGDDDSLIHKDSACFIIENAPTIDPEQRWIPCTPDTMPEEAGTYLCTCADAGRLIVTLIKWQPRMKSWNLTGSRTYWKVIAWMPLPEPYQAESEE